MNKGIHILSTAQLSESLMEMAMGQGVALDAIPFIKTEGLITDELRDDVLELCGLPVTAVFTSAHAVRAVAELMKEARPAWSIYCVGEQTKDEAERTFKDSEIKGVAGNAADLAEMIISDDVLEVVFFCGNKRLDVLPGLLQQEQISVHEVVVYNTVATPVPVAAHYDGILFFSPSAVDSFFGLNNVQPDTILFSIGNTTAQAIKKYSANRLVISEETAKEKVLGEAITYFQLQASATTK